MLDAKHLLWLAEIVDLGSLSRAAQKLHVTQPTLTRAVQVIEDHVGGQVLVRERHGVRPTRIGERLVESGRKIAENRILAEDIVDLWKDGLERELRIGVGPMLAFSVMGRFFAEMVRHPPSYALRVVSATASRLIERLNDDELDVALAPEQMNLFQDDLVQSRVLTDELAIFGGARNTLVGRSGPLPAKELEGQTWISVGALSGIYGSNKEVLTQLGVSNVPSKIAFTGDILMAIEILRGTDALCMLPRRLTRLAGYGTDLHAIETETPLPSRNVALWSRRVDRDRPDIAELKLKLEAFLAQASAPSLPPHPRQV